MRHRRLLATAALIVVSAILITRDGVPSNITTELPPTPTPSPAGPSSAPLRPLTCTTQVEPLEKIDRLLSYARSPDGQTLAVVRWLDPSAFTRALVRRTPDPAQQRIQLFDLHTLRVVDDIGAGSNVLWSGSGRYLSYRAPPSAGAQGDRALIVYDLRARQSVARLRAADIGSPTVAWDDDALVYLDGLDVHRWEVTGDRVVSSISVAYMPVSGLPWISSDGQMFVNALGLDGTAPVSAFVIEAASGRATTLTGVRWVEWSPTGHRLLVRYDDHRELIDESGTVRRANVPFLGTSVVWTPDGREPLFVDTALFPTTPPHFRSLTSFDGRPTGMTLPAMNGSFDPDGGRFIGRWSDGYTPPELRVYVCRSP